MLLLPLGYPPSTSDRSLDQHHIQHSSQLQLLLQNHTLTKKPPHLSRRLIRLNQHLREAPNAIGTANLLDEQRHLDDVEVLAVQIVDLLEILLLHFAAGVALRAGVGGAGEEQLVDDHGVGVDFVGAEFLDHALGFVEGEELGDEDGDEAGRDCELVLMWFGLV